MIIVTGAAGFIGSCLISFLNQNQYNDIVAVDDFDRPEKENNLKGKTISEKVNRDDFHEWVQAKHMHIQFIFHLGARTDTTEFDTSIFDRLNLTYSKKVWNNCVEYGIPLVYASSAATYGEGELGYDDDEAKINSLKPLNPYGDSKNEFDKWCFKQNKAPYFWCGLKFFNVYGPNEYHKGRMASVIWHAYKQIKQSGKMKLFRSHRTDFKDGEQLRDFIYVKDLCNVCLFLLHHRKNSGIYNLGSGEARTFNDLILAVFKSLQLDASIDYIDIPQDIRNTYQYYTQANMNKLKKIGYSQSFTSLENGVEDYVQQYLMKESYY
ncbi:MAG TPA: ADP-glyceromanno-heptose 6-epimerase [Bacteroidia bacterium]|nr:ADP-glyceromanno-heptose 6-epimerase [Bacteroidia bacterium]